MNKLFYFKGAVRTARFTRRALAPSEFLKAEGEGKTVKIRSQVLALAVICCAARTAPLWGQVRKLHTRDMTRLSQIQVADYLKRSDIIFIPVGAVETNGIMPSDRDYVSPLAYAMAMADELDALYMPGLIWSYPGTTMIAQATVNISPSQGVVFLKALAQSLLTPGFPAAGVHLVGTGARALDGRHAGARVLRRGARAAPLYRYGYVSAEAEAARGCAEQGVVRRALHHRTDRSICR